jgi:hypothetical protein
MAGQVLVGGAIPVGEYTEALGDELAELGAVIQRARRPGLDPRFRGLLASVQSRIGSLEAAAQAKPQQFRPMLRLTQGVRAVAQAAAQAAAAQRVKSTRDYLEQPTHVIPVPFDAVAATSLSGVATVKAPHGQPWRLCSIHTNDAQCTGIRVVSIKLANTEHVVASNVSFSSGGPTNAGIDAALFSGKMYRGLMASYQYRPWGLGRGGWLRSDAELQLQVYNPGAAAVSLNLSLLVQSSPCGEGTQYGDKTVFPVGSPEDRRMWRRLSRGLFNFFPRIPRRK